MSGADRHKRIKSIFLQVCELPKGERAAFLDEACGDDAEMRAEIEEMVGFEEENPAFLEGTSTDAPVPKVASALRRDLPKTVTGADGMTDEEQLAELSKRLEQKLNEIENASNVHGRYVFEDEIGRGGMGAVLRVFDTDLHRKLAMKVVLGQRGETDQGPALATLLRFIEEAQVTGQLDHPGVVPVHELGVDDDGRMYFTMRLVKGMHLGEVMKLARAGGEGWNRTRALGVVLKVCETLAYAHSKGVVHRDLKPANVMVGRFGETYVMDWGIARVLGKSATTTKGSPERTSGLIIAEHLAEGSPALTKEGGVLGTPYYMPVEQARGVLEDIGPHTDVYAAGAMLYELLTGRRPYEAPDETPNVATVLAGILQGPPTPVHRLAPREAPELLAICEKAMAYEWRQRYPSMVEMAEDLRAFLEGRVVQAHATDYVTRFRKWVARNRLLAGSLAAIIVISVASVSTFLWQQDRRLRAVRAQQAETALARDAAHRNEERALANAAAATRQSYVANIAAADASLRATEIREAKRLLELCPPELRQWEWEHLELYADTSEAVLAEHDAEVRALARQLGGPLVASSSEDGVLLLEDVDSRGAPTELAQLETAASHLCFLRGGKLLAVEGARARTYDVVRGELVSAVDLPVEVPTCATSDRDGHRIALGADDYTVRVVGADGRSLAVRTGHEGTILAVAFASNGLLASASEDGTVRLWGTEEEQAVDVLDLGDGTVLDVAFSLDGHRLAAATAGGTVWLSTGADAPRPLYRHDGPAYAVAFSTDGRRLASASFDKTVRVFDLDANRLEVTLRGHERPVRCVAFDVSGRTLVTGGEDRTVREWNVESSRAVATHPGPGDYVSAVSSGGEWLAAGTLNGAIEVSGMDGLEPVRRVAGEEDGVFALAFSPDHRLLAAGYESAGVRVFDVETLEPVHEFASHGLSVTCVAFAPDGRLLASGSHDEAVHVQSLDGDEDLQVLTGIDGAVTGVAFAPDGRRLAATAANGRLAIWNVDGWTLGLVAEDEARALTSLAWSPDGSRIVAGGEDAYVRVFDTERGEELGVLEGHDQRVSQVAFAPDGQRFVSASSDGTLRVWDADSKRPLLSLRGHDGPVSSVCFAEDGEDIVSGGFDGTVRVWRTRAP